MSLSYLDSQLAEALPPSEDIVRSPLTLKARVMTLALAAISAHPAAVLFRVGVALSVAMWLVHLAKAYAG